jgi:AcrR family transcriptional regulator
MPEPASTREPPRTARGARTRAAIVQAARTVFERDGYHNARLTDITAEAGSATGSFTYFTNKEEVFAAVLAEVQEEMLHPHVRAMTESNDPVALIEAANRAYLLAYRRNAGLMRLLEEVALIDDDIRELRRRRGRAFAERNAEFIRDLQARGLADPELDPLLAASALSGMVGRIAYSGYVGGEAWDLDDLVATLTRLWANALRIR